MKTIFKFSLLIAVFAILLSCGKNPATEPVYDHTFPGKWSNFHIPKQVYSHESHSQELVFICDSFYLKYYHRTDAADPGDSCSRFTWFEYAKGTFTSTKELLSLNGIYTTENYEPAVEGCETGEFLVEYNYNFEKGELVLKNDSRRENFRLKKEEKYQCEIQK
jgi:hypothetical protein